MKYSELEIAGMLQDNQSIIYELKEEIAKLKGIISRTISLHKRKDLTMGFKDSAMKEEEERFYDYCKKI